MCLYQQVELPQSQEKSEAKLSKKRKADTAAELPAALESQLQAKPTPTPKQKLAPTPANTPATAAKQKKTGNSAAAAAPASAPAAVTASAADEVKAKKQKTAAAAAAPVEGVDAGLSKSQLKKQRKQARVNGEASAAGAADTPGMTFLACGNTFISISYVIPRMDLPALTTFVLI